MKEKKKKNITAYNTKQTKNLRNMHYLYKNNMLMSIVEEKIIQKFLIETHKSCIRKKNQNFDELIWLKLSKRDHIVKQGWATFL